MPPAHDPMPHDLMLFAVSVISVYVSLRQQGNGIDIYQPTASLLHACSRQSLQENNEDRDGVPSMRRAPTRTTCGRSRS